MQCTGALTVMTVYSVAIIAILNINKIKEKFI